MAENNNSPGREGLQRLEDSVLTVEGMSGYLVASISLLATHRGSVRLCLELTELLGLLM